MRKLLFLLLFMVGAKVCAQNPDSLTFAVLGNSISTYYDYIPAGYAIYYTQDREKNYGFQVGAVNVIRESEYPFLPVINIGFDAFTDPKF